MWSAKGGRDILLKDNFGQQSPVTGQSSLKFHKNLIDQQIINCC